jgi:hypothetical protein
MPITLADIELTGVQDIKTDETRSLVKHRIPGLEGDLIQDLGRKPTTISFEGIFKGEEALDHIEILRQKFKNREAVVFVSDITDSTDVTDVMIENLRITEVAGKAAHYRYWLILREYIPPPPPADDVQDQQQQAAQAEQDRQVQQIANEQITLEVRVQLQEGETDYSNIKVEVYDEQDNLVATLTQQVDGIYRKENLPTGNYKAVVKRK